LKIETETIEIIKRTHDVKSFRFLRPPNFDYKAGQYMFITIPNKDQKLSKHFTISSSPTEKKFLEFTKKLTGSEYSTALENLSIGDKVIIDAPYGRFTLDKENKIAMLSGGIGITPLRSICKYATDLKLKKSIILLYGNNTAQDIAFKDEFENLQKQNKNLKIVHIINQPPPEWKGYTGYINANTIKKEIADYKNRVFYTCGPPGMINAMKKILQELNIPKTQIRIENFAGY
jgi:ferredoxin-NADP reductase